MTLELSTNASVDQGVTLDGLTYIAACDQGHGYNKPNEDRMLILPDRNIFVSIDGFNGPEAADIVKKICADSTLELKAAVVKAHSEVVKTCGTGDFASKACVMAVQFDVRRNVAHLYQAGDVIAQGLYTPIINEKTKEMNTPYVYTAPQNSSINRRIVINTVGHPQFKLKTECWDLSQIERIALCTDGITDNISLGETARLSAYSKDDEEFLYVLWEITNQRMLNYEALKKVAPIDGTYNDGLTQPPKKDHRQATVIENFK